MSRVVSIDALVGDVATAAEHQARSLGDIFGSVAEADEATRHNVRIIDQSAAAVRRFHDQAAVLAGLVGHFKIGEVSRVRLAAASA